MARNNKINVENLDPKHMSARAWAKGDNSYFPVQETAAALEPGYYEPRQNYERGPFLNRMDISTDELIHIPDESFKVVEDDVELFWETGQKYNQNQLAFKRGILLFGPPGGGKTSLLHIIGQKLVRAGGVVFCSNHPQCLYEGLTIFRRIEPNRPVMVVLEDIDSIIDEHGEAGILSILDGEHSFSGVLNVATTNYPDRLDARIVSRPGRFDRLYFIGMPSPQARLHFLKTKCPTVSDDVLEAWVKRTADWPIAYLRELVISTQIMGMDETTAFKNLNEMIDMSSIKERADRKKFGFSMDSDSRRKSWDDDD